MQWINSFTLKELYDNRDGNFIHHDQRTAELDSPVLEHAYANTLKFKIKSSQFGKKIKTKDGQIGKSNTWYNVFVLFEDFYCIGKDKEISFEDAIDYAINFGDIHIRCSCPAMLYWGYAYQGTQMKYLYGIPKEKRFPVVRNPNLKGTICKHCDAVVQYIMRNKELITRMFATYYNRLGSGQSIYAVNPQGTTITIGHKEKDGDIFFEQQQEFENEEENVNTDETENTEAQETDDWGTSDPTANDNVIWDDEE